MPHLEQLQSELTGKVKAVKINAAQNTDVAFQYAVTALPTVMLFNKGQVAHQWVGVQKKDALKRAVEALKN